MKHKLLNAEYTSMLTTGKVETPKDGKYAYGFQEARVNGDGEVGQAAARRG